MCSLLPTLPAELYSAILSFVPAEELQRTAYALVYALGPSCAVLKEHLFTYIRLTYPEQAVRLYLRLNTTRRLSEDHVSPARWVRELSLETWSVDADVFINLVKLLPNLESLSLRIGPNNFSPEHLEELFTPAPTSELYFPKLRYLGLRFRPYVQRATYFQFLKGAYFDSTLAALSRWSQSRPLPVLSIVQDPLDRGTTINHVRQSFAQPIVFFRLDIYLSILLYSQNLARSLSSLRLRIPGRAVARSLCTTPPHVTHDEGPSNLEQHIQHLTLGEIKPSPPLLRYLDLSTCGVLEGEVDMILMKYPVLEHLVLDGCSVLRGELREGEWAAMGKRCALIGVRRAKERERKVRAWLESRAAGDGETRVPAEEPPTPVAETQRPRRGRRGLATATISIRDREPRTYGPSIASHSTRSSAVAKIRILPPLPKLRSLSTTTSPLVRPEKYPMIRSEFETGWAEGVALLRVTRGRLRANAGTGVRVMEFIEGWDGSEEGLAGLSDADKWEEEEMGRTVLCLAGGEAEEGHAAGCGHEDARQIWKMWDGVL